MKKLILLLLLALASCDEGFTVDADEINRQNKQRANRNTIKRPPRVDTITLDSIKEIKETIIVIDTIVTKDVTIKTLPTEHIPVEIQYNNHYNICANKDILQYLLEGALRKMLKRDKRPLKAITEWELSLYNLQYTHPKISKRLEKIVQSELNYIINTIRIDLQAVADESPDKDYIYLKRYTGKKNIKKSKKSN